MDKEHLDELESMLLKFVMEHGTPYTTIHYSAERGLKVYEDEKAREEWNALLRGDNEKSKYSLGDMLRSKINNDWVEVIVEVVSNGHYKTKYFSGAFDGMVSHLYGAKIELDKYYTLIGNVLTKRGN